MPAYKKSEWEQLQHGDTVTHGCVFLDSEGEIHAIDTTGRVQGVKVINRKALKAPRHPIRWYRPRVLGSADKERLAAAQAKRERKLKGKTKKYL